MPSKVVTEAIKAFETSSFEFELSKFGEKAIANSEAFIKKIAFELYSRVVKRTPVDTGRAKANTQLSINSTPKFSTLAIDKTESSPIADAGSIDISASDKALETVGRFQLGDTIFLYNNLEYILPLEFGHSQKQAPSGMFRISFEEIVQKLGAKAI